MAKGLSNAAFMMCLFMSVMLLENAVQKDDSFAHWSRVQSINQGSKSALLEVQVLDASQKPVPGASLQMFLKAGRSFRPLSVLTTDLRGRLSVSLDKGTYLLVARARGYARSSQWLDLSDDESITVDLTLARRLKVEVVGEQGPVSGATVLVTSTEIPSQVGTADVLEAREYPHGRATTPEGIAEFFDLQASPYRVQIFAPGYESYEAETGQDLLVRLRKSSGIRVSVSYQGEPVAGARVTIAGAQLWPSREFLVDEKGSILLTGLSAGNYSIYAETGGLISGITRSVEVVAEAPPASVNLVLEQGAFLSLRVLNEQEEPVPDAQITWSEFGIGFFTRQAKTNAKGSSRVGPLHALNGQIAVSANGYISAYNDVEQSGDQEIILQRGGSLLGRVVDQQGRPVAGASVQALGTMADGTPIYVTYQSRDVQSAHFSARAGQSRLLPAGELGVMLGPVPPLPLGGVAPRAGALTTGTDGRFRIAGVAPGRVQIFARHPLFLSGQSQIVDLSGGQEREVEVVLLNGKSFSGRVIDEREFPVSNALIRIVAGPFRKSLRSESDGTFRIDAAPAKFRIAVSRPDEPLVVALEQMIQSLNGEESLLQLPPSRESAQFEILDPQDQPVAMARIRFESESAVEPRSLTRFSDEQGRVVFPSVKGLRGRVQVNAPSLQEWRKTLVLQAEQRVDLKAIWVLAGDVRGVRGRLPASAAKVRLEQGKLSVTVTADEFGHFIAKGLAPGAVWIRAQHGEYGKAEGWFTPKPGRFDAPAELPIIELIPPLLVEGIVVDRAGNTVAGAWISEERLGAYQGLQGPKNSLGKSDSNGLFSVELTRSDNAYLFAAKASRAAGFGERIVVQSADSVEGYRVLLDREDALGPSMRGTVLVTLEQEASTITIYSAAATLQGDLQQGDQLLQIEGQIPENVEEARRLLSGEPGTEVLISLSRNGKEQTRRIKRQRPAR